MKVEMSEKELVAVVHAIRPEVAAEATFEELQRAIRVITAMGHAPCAHCSNPKIHESGFP